MGNNYFQHAMDAFGKFRAAADFADVDAILHGALKAYGYERYFLATPYNEPADTLDRRALLLRWPREWREQYARLRLVEHDPICKSFRSARRSYRWDEVPAKTAASRRVMEMAAADYDMSSGYCVPMFGLHGYFEAGLSIAGRDVENTAQAHFAIELISVYAFNSIARLKAAGCEKQLTPRESEVLRWIALGKTAWDVSAILKISEETVKSTATSAMRRLNTYTRAQTVAEAIRRNEISL